MKKIILLLLMIFTIATPAHAKNATDKENCMSAKFKEAVTVASVKVIIYDPTGAKQEVELPDDVTMRDLIPKMVKRMDLPKQAYGLKHKSSGHVFDADESLASINIKPGDSLEIFRR